MGAQGMSVWKQRQRIGQLTMFSRQVHVRWVTKAARHKIAESQMDGLWAEQCNMFPDERKPWLKTGKHRAFTLKTSCEDVHLRSSTLCVISWGSIGCLEQLGFVVVWDAGVGRGAVFSVQQEEILLRKQN